MPAFCPPSTLKICVSSGVPSARLAALLALQRAEEPETPVVLQEVSLAACVEGLKDGRYDAGVTLAATAAPFMSVEPLWRDELAIAVPERSPLLSYAAIPLETLQSYRLLQCWPQACEALFGTESPTSCITTSYELMTVLVAAGYGVGIAPRSRIMQARSWGVVMRPLAGDSYWVETNLLWSLQSAPAIERFARRAHAVE